MDETCLLKDDSFNIFCMMILPEILRASGEVLGPIFVKLFCIYIYIYRLLHGVYMSQMDKCIFYEFYVSLNVYLQYTMFDLTS